MPSPLRAIKSDKYRYRDTRKSNNYIDSIQEMKQRTKTKIETKNTKSNKEKEQ